MIPRSTALSGSDQGEAQEGFSAVLASENLMDADAARTRALSAVDRVPRGWLESTGLWGRSTQHSPSHTNIPPLTSDPGLASASSRRTLARARSSWRAGPDARPAPQAPLTHGTRATEGADPSASGTPSTRPVPHPARRRWCLAPGAVRAALAFPISRHVTGLPAIPPRTNPRMPGSMGSRTRSGLAEPPPALPPPKASRGEETTPYESTLGVSPPPPAPRHAPSALPAPWT
jgi:hypothetical protein